MANPILASTQNNSQIANILGIAVKIGMLVWLGVYLIFAVILIRQVELMTRTYSTNHDALLKLVTWIHLGIVLLLIVVVLVGI